MFFTDKPRFLLLYGLPGSGKTTYRKTYIEESKLPWVVISTDDYIENKAKDFGITYNEAWGRFKKEAEKYRKETLRKAIKGRKNIIWDQCNVNQVKRYNIIQSVPEDYEKIVLGFYRNTNTIKKVNEERKVYGRGLPDDILDDFIKEFTK